MIAARGGWESAPPPSHTHAKVADFAPINAQVAGEHRGAGRGAAVALAAQVRLSPHVIEAVIT